MSNTGKLREYLIGESGYLLNEISKGKVIMLSGEWGSGKTHFWHLSDDSIKAKLVQKAKPNIYISLYGKSSLQEIENEVFTKAYYKSKGRDDNKKDAIEKLSSTFSKLSSYVDEVSPIKITPLIDYLGELKEDSQKNSAEELMKEGLIIAFDDFERKSTLVNLNDLFGFITNLTIQYKTTIVIILNDDVFEGKVKEIFTNVNEKTVSKYLKFAPTCDELFEIIIQDTKYISLQKDEQLKNILKKTFDEVSIVNARILIQMLDNILEWKNREKTTSDFYLRYFVLSNINFILNHYVFKAMLEDKSSTEDIAKVLSGIYQYYKEEYESNNSIKKDSEVRTTSQIKVDTDFNFYSIRKYLFKDDKYSSKFIEKLRVNVQLGEREEALKENIADYGDILLDFINENEALFRSLHFMHCFKIHSYGESNNNAEVDILNQINSFIETGII